MSRKKFVGLCGLCGLWRVLGGQTPLGTIRDLRLGQKEPFELKKISTLTNLRQPLEATQGRDQKSTYQVAIGGKRSTCSQNFRPLAENDNYILDKETNKVSN